jgi:glycosyltransferase involved in cell wall biosynthesis
MIHFVHSSSGPGGIEVLLPSIASEMETQAFRAFVLRPPAPGIVNVYEGTGVPVCYGSKSNLPAFWALWRYARRYRQDIFQVFNIGPYYLLMLRLAGVKKIIYSIHGTIYWKKRREKWLRKIAWRLAKIPGMIFTANSQYSKAVFVQKVLPDTEPNLLYNPIDVNRFSPAGAPAPAEGLHIIYAGRLARGKNLFRWLDVAAAIAQRVPGCRFTLYGDGPLCAQLEAYAAELGLSEQVGFAGHVEDVAAAYRSADLLLFLSEYESFGNVVVESILCGTPVIASNIPSMREIFEGYPEFLVELDEDLEASVVAKLAELPKLKALAMAARQAFAARFNIDQHVAALNQLYEHFS